MATFPRKTSPHTMGREYWDYWNYPSTLYQQKFGNVLDSDRSKDGFFTSSLFAESPFRREFMSRHSSNLRKEMMSTGSSTVKNDPNQFQILLDVSQFQAGEVDVKTIDHEVIIHAKHDEKEDEHGKISREFKRRIVLPLGVDPLQITALYDSKGILAIRAPKEVTEKTGKETFINVEKESTSSSSHSKKPQGQPEKSARDSSTGRKSTEPRKDFFKTSTEATNSGNKDIFRSEPLKETSFFKSSIDPKNGYYESKSTYSSSSVQRTSMTTNERPTGTRPKQLVTDV